MIWFFIWFIINILGLGLHLAKHGTPKIGFYSFWAKLFAIAFEMWLMHMWGAFDTLLSSIR